ncbi:MAG: hypothetical protein D6798_13260 [Deltaproteobacteria bacterium]|nr:MAG: hypothetical protein D6798_13260 [Deltaproteobacteria bacterium]
MRTAILRGVLAVGATVVALGGVEAALRLSGADRRAVNRALYYLTVDEDVHEPDPGFLQYRLKPGAEGHYQGRWGPYDVHIGPLGDRGGQLPVDPVPGHVRIGVLGGSTVYGAEVSDEQALPAALQRGLRARGVMADVGNFGTSAWVTAQMAFRGREILAHQLDLLILIHTNEGPRPFLMPPDLAAADFSPWFRSDPRRWLEHLPPRLPISADLQVRLLQASATWRYLHAALRGDGDAALPYAAARGREQVRLLQQTADILGVPVLYLLWPEGWDGWPDDLPVSVRDATIDLDALVEDPALKVEHPPPEGLAWYGELLADLLVTADTTGP